MSGDDTTAWSVTTPFDWYVEASRTTLELSLDAQQAAIDGWASALTPQSAGQPTEVPPILASVWLFDIWSETLQNALVHLDDAINEEGVDLDSLQLLWLHALDDAITDVGKRPTFGETMTEAVERTLTAQHWGNELRRGLLESVDVATDRDMEAVGKRLLDLEYRQKSIEDKLDAVLAAVETESDLDQERTVDPAPTGDAR